jgi:hypothetical protein
MKVLRDSVTLLAIGLIVVALTTLGLRWPFARLAEGELRCEGAGAIVVNVAGKDYAMKVWRVDVTRPYSKFGKRELSRHQHQ